MIILESQLAQAEQLGASWTLQCIVSSVAVNLEVAVPM